MERLPVNGVAAAWSIIGLAALTVPPLASPPTIVLAILLLGLVVAGACSLAGLTACVQASWRQQSSTGLLLHALNLFVVLCVLLAAAAVALLPS